MSLPPTLQPGARGSRRAAWLAALALTLAALAIRFVGLDCMLPYRPEPDSQVLVRQFEIFRGEAPRFERDIYLQYYPHVIAGCAALLPYVRETPPSGASVEAHLRRAAAPILHVRRTVALLSVLIVPATWLLARVFLGGAAALFSASLVAVSLLDVLLSQQTRPHAPAAAFAVLAVFAAVRLARHKDLASHAFAGLAGGLAVGTLQSGAAVLPVLFAALAVRGRPLARRNGLGIAAALVLLAACALLAYPSHSGEVVAKPGSGAAASVLALFSHPIHLDRFNGKGFRELAWIFASLETLTTLLALAGLLLWTFSRRPAGLRNLSLELRLVLLYVLPYALAVGLYEKSYERFFLQLVPFAAILAGWTYEQLVERAPRGSSPRVRLLAALLLLAWPTAAAIGFVRQRARTDTRALAARWIEEHVEPETTRIFLIPGADLPLLRTFEALSFDVPLDWGTPWRIYQAALAPDAVAGNRYDMRSWPLRSARDIEEALRDPMAFFQSVGARYVVIDVPNDEQQTPFALAFHRALREHAERVFRAPEQAGEEVLGQNALPSYSGAIWSLRALAATRPPGNSIEIYRLP